MSVKLYLRDNVDGTMHEYGTSPHDSLMVMDDGSLHYFNLQNGAGTIYQDRGYTFVFEDGRDPRDPDLHLDEPLLDFGGDYYEHKAKEFMARLREASGT